MLSYVEICSLYVHLDTTSLHFEFIRIVTEVIE